MLKMYWDGIDLRCMFMLLLLNEVGMEGENVFCIDRFLIIFDGNKFSGIMLCVGLGFGIDVLFSCVDE